MSCRKKVIHIASLCRFITECPGDEENGYYDTHYVAILFHGMLLPRFLSHMTRRLDTIIQVTSVPCFMVDYAYSDSAMGLGDQTI